MGGDPGAGRIGCVLLIIVVMVGLLTGGGG